MANGRTTGRNQRAQLFILLFQERTSILLLLLLLLLLLVLLVLILQERSSVGRKNDPCRTDDGLVKNCRCRRGYGLSI